MAFENRHYVIISVTALDIIDFSEVLETSAETCRYSVDGSKTFVKYEGNQPQSVVSLVAKSQEYTHEQILEILSSSEWTSSDLP